MMKRTCLVILIVAVAVTAFAQQEEVVVSAAASLTDVLSSLRPEAERYVGARILLNFASSGALRKQIEEGAPADVFFSAASEDMDRLEKAGLIAPGSRRDLLSNAMVLIGAGGEKPVTNAGELRSLLSQTSLLAIGNPDSVPAGRYAKQALTSLGLYPLVEKKLVFGGNVRQVLQYVETGSAPLGVVFLTDAMSLKQDSPVVRLYQFPESSLAAPVIYPVAVVAGSRHADKAAKFVEFLLEAASASAFTMAGFIVR